MQEVNCPYCGEKIKAAAKKCKHCKSMLDARARDIEFLKSQGQNVYANNAASSSASAAGGASQTIFVSVEESTSSGSWKKAFTVMYTVLLAVISYVGVVGKKIQTIVFPYVKSRLNSLTTKEKYYCLGAIAVIIVAGIAMYNFNTIRSALMSRYTSFRHFTTETNLNEKKAAPAVEQVKSEADKINELRNAAEHGDAQAQFNMGEAYRYGNSVQQDDTQASMWYRKAADQGNALAKNALADIEAQREQDSSEEGEGDVRQQSNDKSQGNSTTDAQQGACKPYTTPDGTQSGIACKQADGTWLIKTSQNSK